MIRAILGTAGHIDHGKTALVRALTGTDTDVLKEEKERGITIDLGFTELAPAEGRGEGRQPDPGENEQVALGVVDVPGHEDFVRTMVAGASGMDVVVLVVASDEGVMPQTREHLAILEFLDVPRMVVALTKVDLVEAAWLELVKDEVRETLAGGPFAGSVMVPVSAQDGTGLEHLGATLAEAAREGRGHRSDGPTRLPVDRSFTVRGTGTVVTGTLWSGRLGVGDSIRVLPGGLDARVRGLQVHGREVQTAEAGTRTAVAVAGPGIEPATVGRGSTLVHDDWPLSSMLTVQLRVLPETGWRLEHNQRVHLHLATQEVRARCALLQDADALDPGQEGWVQLRLEEPVVARVRDRIVIRSFSPVTTIAGGTVAEMAPPKRKRLVPVDRRRLGALVEGSAHEAVRAAVELCGWAGLEEEAMARTTGLSPSVAADGTAHLETEGGARVEGSWFASSVIADADGRILAALEAAHRARPLRATVPLPELRQALPEWAPPALADGRIQALADRGELTMEGAGARAPEHVVSLDPRQEALARRLVALHQDAGLAPPERAEYPSDLLREDTLDDLLAYLVASGELVSLDPGLWIARAPLEDAVARVRTLLGGRTELGPADFREALPVTRKHLIPLLGYMDREGVTLRSDDGRSVHTDTG